MQKKSVMATYLENNGNLPLVSIGIPVYNVEPYIKRCLLSALNQTYHNLEILVVDDCGTDNSMQIVSEIKQSHPNGHEIRIIKHLINKGVGEARNTIMRECKGKYVYFIDSDDYVEPNAIELLCFQAETNETDVVIASHRNVSITNGEVFSTYLYQSYLSFKGKDSFANYVCTDLRWHVAVVVWNILFSVEFLKKYKFQFAGRKDEDALFLSDFYSEVKSAIIMPDITYNYVVHPGSIMGNMPRKQIPIREIRERFATDAIMTERCRRLRNRSFYDVHCARVMKHKLRAACVALRHRKHFTELLPYSEIHKELRHPASLSDIIHFKRYRFFHLFLFFISKLPPSISVMSVFFMGKIIGWI